MTPYVTSCTPFAPSFYHFLQNARNRQSKTSVDSNYVKYTTAGTQIPQNVAFIRFRHRIQRVHRTRKPPGKFSILTPSLDHILYEQTRPIIHRTGMRVHVAYAGRGVSARIMPHNSAFYSPSRQWILRLEECFLRLTSSLSSAGTFYHRLMNIQTLLYWSRAPANTAIKTP